MSLVEIHQPAGGESTTEGSQRLRVAIADDHPVYRDRLAIFLRDRGLDVVGEVGNGRAAIELSRSAEPDVTLMDLRMPLVSGFEAIRRLARSSSPRPILAISAAAMEDEIADAILFGANGHVSKDRPLTELIWAIRATAEGRALISPGTAQVLLRRIRGEAAPERSLAEAVMFPRELELLACLAQSYTTTQIAITLSASTDEINQDIEWLLTKLRTEQRMHDAVRERASGGTLDE